MEDILGDDEEIRRCSQGGQIGSGYGASSFPQIGQVCGNIMSIRGYIKRLIV